MYLQSGTLPEPVRKSLLILPAELLLSVVMKQVSAPMM